MYLGDYLEDETVFFCWSSNDGDGAAITRATDGAIRIYRDDGDSESTTGITDTEDFDGVTGVHNCVVDLSSSSFYAKRSDFSVVLVGAVIDGQTVNSVIANFSIENRYQGIDFLKNG
ncbi:hypothetical protein KAR91_50765 [Candidatus Pacearchaeota archaeon]|nr:hypothetical protein [Candidatus Pacearchaeota archaeon]